MNKENETLKQVPVRTIIYCISQIQSGCTSQRAWGEQGYSIQSLNSSMNLWWKVVRRSITPGSFSSAGKIVHRTCHVPGTWKRTTPYGEFKMFIKQCCHYLQANQIVMDNAFNAALINLKKATMVSTCEIPIKYNIPDQSLTQAPSQYQSHPVTFVYRKHQQAYQLLLPP